MACVQQVACPGRARRGRAFEGQLLQSAARPRGSATHFSGARYAFRPEPRSARTAYLRYRGARMSARVLVVDDERLIRSGLSRALQDAGYEPEQAGSVAEALDAVGREMPDLVLLDYKLPDGLGLEVLRQVHKGSPRTPVVLITAHASIGGAVEAMKEGAYDYVAK